MSRFAEYRSKNEICPSVHSASELVIRMGQESDGPALAAIAAEREGTSQAVEATAFRKFMRQSAETGRSIVLVAESRNVVVGFGKCIHFTPPLGAGVNTAPEGWYLMGVIVTPEFRRRGVGHQLTQARLNWVAQRASKAYYFVNAQNRVSIELHRPFGFLEVTRDFSFPHVTFDGGTGILFQLNFA